MIFSILILSFCALPVFSQTQDALQNQETLQNQSELTDLQQNENNAFPDFFSQNKSSTENEKSGPSTFWLFFRTLVVLILVVVAIYFIFKFVRKSTSVPDTDDDPFLKRVAAVSVANGKSVQVLTLQEHCYVVGVGDDSVNLIAELDPEKDKDLITAMTVKKDSEPAKKKKSFSSIFETVMGVKNKKNSDNFKSGILNLKAQTSRLHAENNSTENNSSNSVSENEVSEEEKPNEE